MRVISGERKGFNLQGPLDFNKSRPTEDRIKESIFDIIQPVKKDSLALDLFCASGQIGIEFLSRGSSFVYFNDKDRTNIKLLKENLIKTKYEDKAKVYNMDYRQALSRIERKLDYIFLDPPYESNMIKNSLELILSSQILKDDASIIIETDKDIDVEDLKGLREVFKRRYGRKIIQIFKELK